MMLINKGINFHVSVKSQSTFVSGGHEFFLWSEITRIFLSNMSQWKPRQVVVLLPTKCREYQYQYFNFCMPNTEKQIPKYPPIPGNRYSDTNRRYFTKYFGDRYRVPDTKKMPVNRIPVPGTDTTGTSLAMRWSKQNSTWRFLPHFFI